MYKDKRIFALIPARGGSKGLPKKNIKPLLEKPLIAWTIEKAKASSYIDLTFVSTEDAEIAKVAERYGAKPQFLRPKKLAQDSSSSIAVVLHAVHWFEKRGIYFDYILLLEPTSPLRKNNDLDDAIKLLIDNETSADSLVSVGKIHMENPYISKVIIKNFVRPLIPGKSNSICQRQQLPDVYFPYGVIYASKIKSLRKNLTFYQRRTIPYFIERWQNFEIDDIYDFVCVEAILREREFKK